MTMTNTDLTTGLLAALEAHHKAKNENPFANHDLVSMGDAGLHKSADLNPALNLTPKGGMGRDMEVARTEAITAAKADKSAKRMAETRARRARKMDWDDIADEPGTYSSARLDTAWMVVAHLVPNIQAVATSKGQWAGRYLGSVSDDLASMVVENMAVMLAKSDEDLSLLLIAAEQIGDETKRTGRVAGEQESKEEKRERKAISAARKWLMGVLNNRVMGTLVDEFYRKGDRTELIDTTMATVAGIGDDPMTEQFKASEPPSFMGTKFQRPGGIDAGLKAAAITAAITDHGLDAMVEFILNDDNRTTNGAVKWSENAEALFKLTPGNDGPWMWTAVYQATEGRNNPRKARGDAARAHVRNLFQFLPTVIDSLDDAFDQQFVAESDRSKVAINADGEIVTIMATARNARTHAVLTSVFEHYRTRHMA